LEDIRFMLFLIRLWFGFWIRLVYLLRLRNIINVFQRWLKERKAEKSHLRDFDSPENMVNYARTFFDWRRDETRVGGIVFPLDWISHPEVFERRLEKRENLDGDCDDYAAYCCAHLKKMGIDAWLCSVGYPGGGHTVCCYEHNGKKYLINYKLQEIQDFNDVPQIIAEWGTRKNGKEPKVYWYLFERFPEFKIIKVCPWGKFSS